MQQVVWVGGGRLELRGSPRPTPSAGEAVVRVARAGVCGSDLHILSGENLNQRPPLVLGHEVSGVVTAVTQDAEPLRVGTRVLVDPCVPCGRCDYCHADRSNLCHSANVIGASSLWPGGWADELRVPGRQLIAVPDDVDDASAAMVEPLGVVMHAQSLSGAESGDPVMILGAGAVGLLAAQVFKSKGAVVVVADIVQERLELATRLGADHAVNSVTTDLRDWSADTFGESGIAEVIDCAATRKSFLSALGVVRRGGQVTLIGVPVGEAAVDLSSVLQGGLRLVGVNGYRRVHLIQALDVISSNKLESGSLVTDVVPLQGLAERVQALMDEPTRHLKIQVAP